MSLFPLYTNPGLTGQRVVRGRPARIGLSRRRTDRAGPTRGCAASATSGAGGSTGFQKISNWSDLSVTFSPQHIAPHSATRPNIGSVTSPVSRPESNHRRNALKCTTRGRFGVPSGNQKAVCAKSNRRRGRVVQLVDEVADDLALRCDGWSLLLQRMDEIADEVTGRNWVAGDMVFMDEAAD
jgi:hypothetical protein